MQMVGSWKADRRIETELMVENAGYQVGRGQRQGEIALGCSYQAQEEAGLQAAPIPREWVKSRMEPLVPFSLHTIQVTVPLPPQQKTEGLFSKEY